MDACAPRTKRVNAVMGRGGIWGRKVCCDRKIGHSRGHRGVLRI